VWGPKRLVSPSISIMCPATEKQGLLSDIGGDPQVAQV
jgi:hypothetical protein